jgi:mono/diheme cytochrome c family protein
MKSSFGPYFCPLVCVAILTAAPQSSTADPSKAEQPSPVQETVQQTRSVSAAKGKRLFADYYCYACHGTEGQGGAGPRLIARATADPLIRYVRKPGGVMPAYTSHVISEQDLVDIHAYLKSIPPSPPAKSIPLLQQ